MQQLMTPTPCRGPSGHWGLSTEAAVYGTIDREELLLKGEDNGICSFGFPPRSAGQRKRPDPDFLRHSGRAPGFVRRALLLADRRDSAVHRQRWAAGRDRQVQWHRTPAVPGLPRGGAAQPVLLGVLVHPS